MFTPIFRVMVGFSKGATVPLLNDASEERSVQAVRLKTQHAINIKDLLFSNLPLFGPSEGIPCNSIPTSSHAAKRDELDTTGDPDSV